MEKDLSRKVDLSRPETYMNHLKKLLNYSDLEQDKLQTKQTNLSLPVEVFPEPIRHIIEATNKTLKYPTDFTSASILFAASVAIGNTNQVEVKKGWTETAVLYIALVGRPGTNKSHPLSFALAPLMAKDDQSYFEYTKEKAVFDQLQNLSKEKRNGQELIKPILKKHLVSDTTPEALVTVHHYNNRGIGVYVDELAGWFKSFNRYHKGSEQEFWLSNWSGKSVIIDRKTSDSLRISKPFISVCGTIQTSILDEMAKSNRGQNGFIDRILIVMPENLKTEAWSEQELNATYRDNWSVIIENLLKENLMVSENLKPEPRIITYSPEAKEMLFKWQIKNAEIANRQQNEAITGLFSKIEIYCIRFSLILQLLAYACNEDDKETINLPAVKGAIKLTDYFIQAAIKVYGLINEESPLDKLPKNKQKYYDALPEVFTTNEAIALALKFEMSNRTVKRFLTDKRLFNRLMQGKYEKML